MPSTSKTWGQSEKTKKHKDMKCKGVCPRGYKIKNHKPPCPWDLLVSKWDNEKCWSVKTLTNTHKCIQTREFTCVTSRFLSTYVIQILSRNPKISIKTLQLELTQRLQINVTFDKAFRAKEIAEEKMTGDHKQQYAQLRDYAMELRAKNPGTTVKIQVETNTDLTLNSRVFKRIYVCIGELKAGYKATRREILGLDGAFIKEPYIGKILTAVGIDGNNGIYPVAYVVVKAECKSSWLWLLKNLGDDLDLQPNYNYTFISDRQKGILQAIQELFPSAEHRFCVRHIHENMKQIIKGMLYKDFLWKCATTTTVPQFEHLMGQLKYYDPKAHDLLRKIPPTSWSRAHFSGRAKCEILVNNLCESLNSKLVGGRDKPIIGCLEYIREYLMKRIVNVQKVIDKCEGPLTPIATSIYDVIKQEANEYGVIWNGADSYQCKGAWNDQCVVNMRLRTCTCRRWELTGIPCKHAMATMYSMANDGREVGIPEDWVHQAYWLKTWKETYNHKIECVANSQFWPKCSNPSILLPPHHHVPIGRPRKKRRQTKEETTENALKEMVKGGKLSKKGKTVTCSQCGTTGHNKRACTSPTRKNAQGKGKI